MKKSHIVGTALVAALACLITAGRTTELEVTPGWTDPYFDGSDHQTSGIDVYVPEPNWGAIPEPPPPERVEMEELGEKILDLGAPASASDTSAAASSRMLVIYYDDSTTQMVPLRKSFRHVTRIRTVDGVMEERMDVSIRDADFEGRILLEVSYPQRAGEPEGSWDVLIDDNPVQFRPMGSGFGGGRETRSFAVYPGLPGRKTIEVVRRVGDRMERGEAIVEFAPAAAIVPRWVDGGLVRQPGGLRFQIRYVDEAGVVVRVNDEPVRVTFEKDLLEGFHIRTAYAAVEELVPGENRIEVTAATTPTQRAAPLISRTTLYYAPQGRVRMGDTFRLATGEAGSRSGPFYSVETEGGIERLGETQSLDAGRIITVFRATSVGEATIRIFKKPHFLEPRALDAELRLRVVE